MTTLSEINDLQSSIMRRIAEAAQKGDLATVNAESQKAVELEDIKKTALNIEHRLKTLQSPQSQKNTPLRELPIEATEGMINQNLLTLTHHVKRGRVKVGENLTIEAQPSGERFRTEVMQNGNKLQERGAIGRFYREAGVKPWDFVVLTEIAPTRWTLKKAPPGQYKGRRALLDSL